MYWDNVQPTTGGKTTVTSAAQITDSAKTQVEFSVVLNEPGDYYEFTVDAVNNGTIDAMIAENGIVNKVYTDSSYTTEATLPKVLKYTVTYADGNEIEEYHLLAKKTNNTATRETYKVRVEYNENIDPSDLDNNNDQTFYFKFCVNYVQWEEQEQSYTVSFVDYDNNSIVYSRQKVNEGEHVTEPQEEPTKNNYLFAGWYEKDNYNNISDDLYDFEHETIYENKTLVAKFIPLSAYECPGDNCKYSYYTNTSNIGSTIPDDEFCNVENLEYGSYYVCGGFDYTSFRFGSNQLRNFLGHTLNNNNEITNSYVCGLYDGVNGERTFCLMGSYEGISDSGMSIANRNLLKTVFDKSECEVSGYSKTI